jgi:hypothetical protein
VLLAKYSKIFFEVDLCFVLLILEEGEPGREAVAVW